MTPKAKNLWLLWTLAIADYATATGISIIALLQAMTVAWQFMTPFERQSLILSALAIWLNHTRSFVKNTLRQIKDGKDTPPDDENGNGNGHDTSKAPPLTPPLEVAKLNETAK